MSIFYNWTPNEIAALHRATAKLRAQQITEKPKPKPKPKTGGYYDAILYRRMHNSSELQQRRPL